MSAARPRSVLVGVGRLALFRAEGFAEFGDTPQMFLNSVAPLLGFPVAGALLLLISGDPMEALHGLLGTLVGLLAPPVFSHALARRFDCEAAWLRYAVAFNWCQWVLPIVFIALALMFGPLEALGLPQHIVAGGLLLALVGYGFALHFFLAQRGLGLGRGRSVTMVLSTNIGTFLLMLVPELVQMGTTQ